MKPKPKTVKPFYKSTAWKKLQPKILKRDGYMCQESKRYGRMVPAQTVHHIFPLEDYPEYALARWNLISLSWDEHNQMHDRITGRLTAKGMALLKRTAKAQGISLADTEADMGDMVRRLLVIGLPGAGKTTYARSHMRDTTLVYDLDYIAAAFRISEQEVHEERHGKARAMANDLLLGFVLNASHYTDDIIVIRTAPTIEEVDKIKPTEIVCIDNNLIRKDIEHVADKIERLETIRRYANDKKIIFKKFFHEFFPA